MAQVIDILSQSQILPEIFDLAGSEGFENADDLSMHVVCVVELLLAVE